MSLRFHWFLPTNGDGRDIVGGGHGVATGAAGAIRPASLAYLGQIARSAEQLGFEAALTPTGAWCEDAWLTTAMLTEVTERLKFLVAFRPGLISPTLSAQMAATFQRHSKGLAREAGRTLRYGIRLHVITRDTSHEAWMQANRFASLRLCQARPVRVHPVRVPAPGGGLLVRRGRAAHPALARPVAAPRPGHPGRHAERDPVRPHVGPPRAPG